MKKIMRYPLFILTVLLTACNNNEEPVTKIDNNIPAKEKDLRNAITQFPDSLQLRLNLIEYFELNGNIDNALSEINKTLSIDSLNTVLYDKKAILLIEKKDTAAAIKAYEKAIEIYPDPGYVMTLGLFYAHKKDSNALTMADALFLAPKAKAEKEACIIKGIYYNLVNKKQQSLDILDKCIGMSYTYMPAYREKSITLYDMGKYEEAVKLLERAVKLNNTFEEGYYLLGKNYEQLNDKTNAIKNYQTALMYDPEYLEAKEALAKLGVK